MEGLLLVHEDDLHLGWVIVYDVQVVFTIVLAYPFLLIQFKLSVNNLSYFWTNLFNNFILKLVFNLLGFILNLTNAFD